MSDPIALAYLDRLALADYERDRVDDDEDVN
jgi:hypothetical protein